MSEMVERVARAIWALNQDTDCPEYDQLAPHAKERADEWARAVIAAMREPTEAMVTRAGQFDFERAGTGSGYNETFDLRDGDVKLVWQAMIDEALK